MRSNHRRIAAQLPGRPTLGLLKIYSEPEKDEDERKLSHLKFVTDTLLSVSKDAVSNILLIAPV